MNLPLSGVAWGVCCLSFVFVPGVFRMEDYWRQPVVPMFRESNFPTGTIGDYPILVGQVLESEVSAQAVCIIDLDSAVPLYKRNERMIVYPASATKLVTALTAKRLFESEHVFTVPQAEFYPAVMGLKPGERIGRDALLAGLLIPSGNDAAYTLANGVEGGYRGFVSEMNETVRSLNLVDTNFINPSGLHNDEHVSTARDLVHIMRSAYIDAELVEIMRTPKKIVYGLAGEKHQLLSTNMLWGKLAGLRAGKTGYTIEAGEVLITVVERGERTVVIALLGSRDRFTETKVLADWVFNNFEWKEITLQ